MSDLAPGLPATEAADPRYAEIDAWPARAMLESLLEAQLAAVAAVRPALPAIERAAAAALPRLAQGGLLAYCGAGTSARIAAQDGAELGPTFGWPDARLRLLIAGGTEALTRAIEGAEDDAAAGDRAAAELGPADVLIAVAASGATPYVLAATRRAAGQGALTIGLACGEGPLLAACAHPVLAATGAEPIAGSTRLKAGTAQKVALNLLSTGLMIGLGHVYRGYMVGMVPRNAKLRRRAARMVMTLSGCDHPGAEAALAAANDDIKLAVLVARGQKLADAAASLRQAQGNLRRLDPVPAPGASLF